MTVWPMLALGEIFEIARGGSPRPISEYLTDDPEGVNWISIGDASASDKFIEKAARRIRREGIDKSRLVSAGDLLLTNSMSFGRPYIMRTSGCIHDGWLVLSDRKKRTDPNFFYHLLGSDRVYRKFESLAAGVTVKNLNIDLVRSVEVPLPPLDEQRRIADILDRADSLRAKRRAALAQLNTLTQSIFRDMFGDPAANPKAWPREPLGALSSKFSDGPFGSNLKSEHYTEHGIRVVRLQNIGIGEFLDEDKAYISTRHFESLRKHECRPGDVMIGTLGDPNLRACILPKAVNIALNKADCVQMRVNDRVNAAYICALLNNPSTEKMAKSLMLGQTRVRVSMGRLRELVVPVPPMHLQDKFARAIDGVQRIKDAQLRAMDGIGELFAALQYRAFSGEL